MKITYVRFCREKEPLKVAQCCDSMVVAEEQDDKEFYYDEYQDRIDDVSEG